MDCTIDISNCCNIPSEIAEESVVITTENKESLLGIPRDCSDIFNCILNVSGAYTVYPAGLSALIVQCDMDTESGGWTVVHNRSAGSAVFYTNWEDYKNGFGNSSDFWIGNDNLHLLTTQAHYHLRIDLEDWNNQTRYALYQVFKIGNESTNYTLSIGGYSGTAGDSLLYHDGMQFSTTDMDNDQLEDPNFPSCSNQYSGGWWYRACYESNLHGNILAWDTFGGTYHNLKHSKMMIRP